MEEALYETTILRQFSRLSLERIPDETTILNVRRLLGFVRKALILGHAALKTASECSFTTRKLRFLGCFRLA